MLQQAISLVAQGVREGGERAILDAAEAAPGWVQGDSPRRARVGGEERDLKAQRRDANLGILIMGTRLFPSSLSIVIALGTQYGFYNMHSAGAATMRRAAAMVGFQRDSSTAMPPSVGANARQVEAACGLILALRRS